MSANIHRLGGTNDVPPKRTVLSLSIRASHARTCDELGLCHHTSLDCNENTCHRALLDDGHVDIPLPATPAASTFWLDSDKPEGPPLMNVTMEPSMRDHVWYWGWVFATYLVCVAFAGWLWGKYGDVAVRAFWRVISGVG